ncbi:MAG: TatD family hydrolase [Planctomycetota bacterium]|jgi:TatD DNase family protein
MLIDSHCHLTSDRFADDRSAVIAACRAANLGHCLCIGTGVDDAYAALDLQATWPDLISVAAGLDPFTSFDAGDDFDHQLARLDELLLQGECRALGEIGLDYHYDLDPAPVQRSKLHRQLTLAERHHLPVVIHVRDAHDDMVAVLSEHPDVRGVIHSFTAGPAEAERYLALGWHLAFNGVVTFKNAAEVREAAKLTPADRLLVETDSPYLAPVPLRGKRCQPAYIQHTVDHLAAVRGERSQDIAAWTTRNAIQLFKLPVP